MLIYSWCIWFPWNCGVKVKFRVPENGRGLLGARVCSHRQLLLSQTCVCLYVRGCVRVRVWVLWVNRTTFLWSVYPHVSSTLRSTLCVRVCVLSILLSSNVPFIKVWSQSFAVSGRVLHGQRRRFCRIFCVGWDHHWRCGRLVSRAGGWRGFGSLRLVNLEKN